jgi:hypothetical protein
MKKGLIIKLAIVLVVLVLSYCVFWFFKAGQSEKQINKFIADNSSHISAGEVSVAGFPVAQKITISDLKITIPTNLLAKRQIVVKQLEANADIFSNDFVVNLTDVVKVQDLESSGEVFDVEFANKPEILVSLLGGVISKFQYNDSGFKILDAEKNVVNSSTSSSFLLENSIDEAEKQVSKINISFKDVEGYTVFDLYKNLLDKKVIEAIKTEDIKVNVNPVDQANIQQITAPLAQDQSGLIAQPNAVPLAVQQAQAVDPSQQPLVAINSNVAVAEAVKNIEQINKNLESANAPQPTAGSAPIDPNNQPSIVDAGNQQPVQAGENPIPSDVNASKSNFIIDAVITLTPSIRQEGADVPPVDPTQIQELPVQYVQNIKINNVEMSNGAYKINVAGDLVNSADDNYSSGGITVKIEKIANLVDVLKGQFKQLSQSKKPSIPSNGGDLVSDQSQQNQTQNYDIFLNNISEKLATVSSEIAQKNVASKDDVAQFDVRREKNLEFLINEVPVREIIGKF